MKLSTKQQIFSECIGKLIQFAYANGYGLTFGDAFAKTGHIAGSTHYSRLAVDFNLFKDGVYLTDSACHAELGEYWKTLHPLARWGGDFGDGNHYSFEHNGVK